MSRTRSACVSSRKPGPPGAHSGEAGAFALQLLLDHGAAKHVLPVEAQELRALLQLLRGSKRTSFDPARGLLVFSDLESG